MDVLDAPGHTAAAPPLVRILHEDGSLVDGAVVPEDLDPTALRGLYRSMVLARRLDTLAVTLQRQGTIGIWASARGQEASQVGAAAALQPGDWLFPTYREAAAMLTRGISARELLLPYRGTWLSAHDPHAHGVTPMTIPIGTQCLHAVGWAMGARMDGAPVAALACLGDGATSEGDVSEALNFAGVYAAPCVFLCQNNGWAISVPLAKQTVQPDLAARATAFGVAAVRVDGNDVLAVHAVVAEALARARAGGGPLFVEALTYRMAPHTTSDDDTRYRTGEELAAWEPRDPLARYERFLRDAALWGDADAATLHDEAESLAADTRAALLDAPPPDPAELFAHVYVEPPPALLAQAAHLRSEQARATMPPPGPEPGQGA